MQNRFHPPESRLLKTLSIVFAAGLGTKLGLLLFQKKDTLSDAVGAFFSDLLIPYCYGAFGSAFPLVWLVAAVAGAAFFLAICNRGIRAAKIAKGSLTILLLLSLFTIWLEPFVSMSAAAGNTLLMLAKVPMKIADLGLSIFWAVVYWKATREIDRTVAATDLAFPPEESSRPAPTPERDDSPATPLAVTTASGQGVLTVKRLWSMNQALYRVTVLVDQVQVGKLRSGQTLRIPLAPGTHDLTVKYFWLSTTVPIQVDAGETVAFEQSFGAWVSTPILKRS